MIKLFDIQNPDQARQEFVDLIPLELKAGMRYINVDNKVYFVGAGDSFDEI